ncbi:MAG: aspartate 1-decarboxylase [Elusimicrobiota bacterium]|nr:aspartate 1-decarboxylase [Elusimicrobiota bacterium]
MIRTMLKSKIHRATVTQTDINYNGSITIDKALCKKTNMLENEKVDIYNINSGARFSTYVIYGKKSVIGINGAAARLAQKGDLIIIVSYVQLNEEEVKKHKPVIISL